MIDAVGLWGARVAFKAYQVPAFKVIHIHPKSSSVSVQVGLCQSCPFLPALFVVFIGRISRHSRAEEGEGSSGSHLCFLLMILFSLLFSFVCGVFAG